MGELGDAHRLALESRQRGLVFGQCLRDNFDRDFAVEARVLAL